MVFYYDKRGNCNIYITMAHKSVQVYSKLKPQVTAGHILYHNHIQYHNPYSTSQSLGWGLHEAHRMPENIKGPGSAFKNSN